MTQLQDTLGDSHNFGQRVRAVSLKGRPWIFKPRTVFWEYLLLSRASPLRQKLSELASQTPADFDPDFVLGHVGQATTLDFYQGHSDFISPVQRKLAESDARQFGGILGTAMALGITDFHKQNFLILHDRLQVVDIECLFWDIQLPSECEIFLKRTSNPARSILSDFLSEGQFPFQIFVSLLQGLASAMNFFISNSAELNLFFASLEPELKRHPVRIIFKDTRIYQEHLREPAVSNKEFISEENAQIKNGDIPYFFGFLGGREIFYNAQPNTPTPVEIRDASMRKIIDRAFKSPNELLDPVRLLKVYKQSLLEIGLRLLGGEKKSYTCDVMAIENNLNSFRVRTRDFAVEAKRN